MTEKNSRELINRAVDLLEQAEMLFMHEQGSILDPATNPEARKQVELYQYLMHMSQTYSVTAVRMTEVEEYEQQANVPQ